MTIVTSGEQPPLQASRLATLESASEDHALEGSLRPRSLAEYTGQSELKAQLQIAIQAARGRNEALDHLLLHGPAGLGKTTLAQIAAADMKTHCHVTSAPGLERPRDVAGLLTRLAAGDVLFIDEIHRLAPVAEELLYPAMEDFTLDLTLGKGPTAKIRRVPLERFTLVGATTRAGALSGPLRDRFGMVLRLQFYAVDELTEILKRSAGLLGVALHQEAAVAIAQRSRGTPRVANRLLKRVRDYAQVSADGVINAQLADRALDGLSIDVLGLDPLDRGVLQLVIEQHGGGPVGIEALAAEAGEDLSTLEDVVEPYLLQTGLLRRTPRGRVATATAYRHLGMPEPLGEQLRL